MSFFEPSRRRWLSKQGAGARALDSPVFLTASSPFALTSNARVKLNLLKAYEAASSSASYASTFCLIVLSNEFTPQTHNGYITHAAHQCSPLSVRGGIICENVTLCNAHRIINAGGKPLTSPASNRLIYEHVMHYAGFQTYTIPPPLALLLLSSSALTRLYVLLHGWHRASQPTPGFPSYSQLNVFGGFNQGFA